MNYQKNMYRVVTLLVYLVIFFSKNVLTGQVIHEQDFDRFTHYKSEDWITYAPALTITSIDISEDYIFFGTRYGGILRYDLYNRKWRYPFTTSNGLSSNEIIQIIYNYNDFRWYARTAKGIDVLDPSDNFWKPSYREDLSSIERRKPSEEEINRFYRNQDSFRFPVFFRPPDSQLPDFFTPNEYLFRKPNEILDENNRIFRFTDRIVDQWRNLWLGTDGLGVARANLDNLDLIINPQSLSDIYPKDVEFDATSAWIGGTAFGNRRDGILRWEFRNNLWQYFDDRFRFDIYNDQINVIRANQEFVFFGTNEGLVKYDKKDRDWHSFTTAHGLENNLISDLYFEGFTLIIATDGGVNWSDPPYTQINEPQDNIMDNVSITDICPYNESVLLASFRGLYYFSATKDSTNFFEVDAAINDIGITAANMCNDTLWFAGRSGIAYMDRKSGKWTSFTQIAEQLRSRIHDIKFSGHFVWFATNDGLLRYDKKMDYWYLYTERDGLAHNRIYNIDVQNDELWLSTRGGVTIFRWQRPNRFE
ncbi:MAG: hypothetical protein GF313_16095 [Caldithrix sp.]|nr:hypothetical protein [Caldithrix sp.]